MTRHQPAITLSEALNFLNVERLKELLDLLPGANAPKPSRKAEIIAALQRHIMGKPLRTLWRNLDEVQQSAVSETLYGPAGAFVPTRFRAKYGTMPRFEITVTERRGRRIQQSSHLRLFLYDASRHGEDLVIPVDLQQRLCAFVPRPAAPALPTLDELPEPGEGTAGRDDDGDGAIAMPGGSALQKSAKPSQDEETAHHEPFVRRDMEGAARQDLLAVLRLIDRGKVAVSAKTLQATAASVRNVAAVLCDGDFFDSAPKKEHAWEQTVGPVKAFAWPWLVRAARLAEQRGGKLALTKAGRAALGTPPAETLRRLWQRWIKSTLLDEFNRIEAVKGQRGKGKRTMTAASSRRAAIAEALGECPVGRWVCIGDFSRFIQASDSDFSITRDPWMLYIADPHYGSLGYSGFHDWHILQERYLLCFLFEYAATLGLIDVAYSDPRGARKDFYNVWGTDELEFLSRYDGFQYFRLNHLGAFCLGMTETYEPKTLQVQASLTVLPNLRLEVTEAPLSPDERLLLETYATAESETIWRLDRDKALSALESGHRMSDLRDFLTSRDDQPLPERVDGFLRSTERCARALIPRGTALLIECATSELASLLSAHELTAGLCLRTGCRHLVVQPGDEDAFRKAARRLGYGIPRA